MRNERAKPVAFYGMFSQWRLKMETRLISWTARKTRNYRILITNIAAICLRAWQALDNMLGCLLAPTKVI